MRTRPLSFESRHLIETIRADTEGATQPRARMEGNPDPLILSSGPLGWNGLIAERFRHSPAEHHFPPLPENTASLYMGQPVRSVRWSDHGIREGSTLRGDVTVKASGQPVGWRFDRDVDLLVMRSSPQHLPPACQIILPQRLRGYRRLPLPKGSCYRPFLSCSTGLPSAVL